MEKGVLVLMKSAPCLIPAEVKELSAPWGIPAFFSFGAFVGWMKTLLEWEELFGNLVDWEEVFRDPGGLGRGFLGQVRTLIEHKGFFGDG